MKTIYALLLCFSLLASPLFLASIKSQSRARRVGNATATPTPAAPTLKDQNGVPAAPAPSASRPPVLVNRGGGAQTQSAADQPTQTTTATPTAEEVGDDEVVKVNTTLVTIPVSVLDRDGKFIPYLHQEDFRLYENGVEQQIAYFNSTDAPFTVALLLDTSRSTNFKLEDMQDAAITFVDQLREDDRVMVIAFDDRVRILSEPTNDRRGLRDAIRQARTGGGTRLYDTVDLVINQRFNRVSGRKAIVLFTDGVDTTSRRASYQSTVRDAEELDALIYSVQYDTYSDGGYGTPGGGVIIGGGGGGGNWPYPRGGSRRGGRGGVFGGILNWPIPMPMPGPGGGGGGGGRGGGNGSRDEYDRGTAYLSDLAAATGARVNRADSLQGMARAFELIAEELRRQYSIGYYPKNASAAGERRQIKVRMREPNLVVRTRDSYITASPQGAVATQGENNKYRSKVSEF